jgi:hypothetical protein
LREWLVWCAGAFIILGIVIALITRFAYRHDSKAIDAGGLASSKTVRMGEINPAVTAIMRGLPFGAHRITVTDAAESEILKITFFVRPLFPF